MGLEYSEPKNESDFYQLLRKLTGGLFYYERVEPANESGFPDVYFVPRDRGWGGLNREGTIELKYFKPREKLSLKSAKVRGNQKAALIDYHQAGGNRRYILAYQEGVIYFWTTSDAVKCMTGGDEISYSFTLRGREEQLGHWLAEMMK